MNILHNKKYQTTFKNYINIQKYGLCISNKDFYMSANFNYKRHNDLCVFRYALKVYNDLDIIKESGFEIVYRRFEIEIFKESFL